MVWAGRGGGLGTSMSKKSVPAVSPKTGLNHSASVWSGDHPHGLEIKIKRWEHIAWEEIQVTLEEA